MTIPQTMLVMEPTVRRASRADAPSIRSVAAAGWRDTYDGMIPRPAIESFIERAYSVDRLTQRIERHFFLVAEARGEIIAFAEALLDGDHVNLAAIYAHPARRGQRAGSLLLAGVRDHFRGLSVAADVVDGNRKGEAFYEARGFIPGLTFRTELLGEAVAERRWWLKPE